MSPAERLHPSQVQGLVASWPDDLRDLALEARGDHVELAFLHGAALPDPTGLLHGTGKAKRRLDVRTPDDLRRPAVADLIRAAIAHEPGA
jgi:hypothetical protein